LQDTVIRLTEQNRKLQESLLEIVDRHVHNYVPLRMQAKPQALPESTDEGLLDSDDIGDAYSVAIRDARARMAEAIGDEDSDY